MYVKVGGRGASKQRDRRGKEGFTAWEAQTKDENISKRRPEGDQEPL